MSYGTRRGYCIVNSLSMRDSMYQDYTAIAILLLTAIPVLAVAATVFFYVKNNDRKTPLTREDFYR